MNDIKLFEENQNINLIIKTAGNACNINCTYCFEQAKEIKKEYITPEKLEKVINYVQNTCSIVFHGGEPLIIGIEKFSNLLSMVRKYYPNKVIAVRIQTNGTLLTEEWLSMLFVEYKDLDIEIAISLDGTRKMNSHRVDYFGKETFDKVREGYELLNQHGKKAGMLSVISKCALAEVDDYIQLIQSIPNISFVKINALFNVNKNQLTEDSITPMEYATFVYEFACKYIESGLYTKIAVEPILSILQNINKRKSRYCNYTERKCFNFLSVYPDGSVGPCDCFSVNEYLICNTENINSTIDDMVRKFVDSDSTLNIKKIIEKCDKCDIREFCQGGCLSQRYYFRNNEEIQNNFCTSKHFLFEKFKIFNIDKKV